MFITLTKINGQKHKMRPVNIIAMTQRVDKTTLFCETSRAEWTVDVNESADEVENICVERVENKGLNGYLCGDCDNLDGNIRCDFYNKEVIYVAEMTDSIRLVECMDGRMRERV
jgi:hypothetical protein